MVDRIAAANSWLNGYVWGWPLIVLLLGTGILLTVLTGAVAGVATAISIGGPGALFWLPNLISVLASIPILLKLKREFFAAEAARR